MVLATDVTDANEPIKRNRTLTKHNYVTLCTASHHASEIKIIGRIKTRISNLRQIAKFVSKLQWNGEFNQ